MDRQAEPGGVTIMHIWYWQYAESSNPSPLISLGLWSNSCQAPLMKITVLNHICSISTHSCFNWQPRSLFLTAINDIKCIQWIRMSCTLLIICAALMHFTLNSLCTEKHKWMLSNHWFIYCLTICIVVLVCHFIEKDIWSMLQKVYCTIWKCAQTYHAVIICQLLPPHQRWKHVLI